MRIKIHTTCVTSGISWGVECKDGECKPYKTIINYVRHKHRMAVVLNLNR